MSHVFRDFGISNYLVQEPNLTPERIRTAFGLSVVFGWPIAIALFFGSGTLAEFYGDPALQNVLMVLSFNFVVLPISVPALTLLRREMNFNLLFKINISSVVAMATTQLSLALLGYGAMALAWASLVNVSVMSILTVIYRANSILMWPSFREWRPILSFGGVSSLTTLFSFIGYSAADLIVGRMLGFSAVGIYSRAQGLIYLFHRDVMGAVHQVAFPAFAAEHRDGGNLRYGYLQALHHVTGIAWPFYAVAAITAEPFITTMFGWQWAASAPLVRLLAIAFSISTLWALSGHVMYATGHPRRMFVAEMTIQTCRIVALMIGAQYSLEAVAAVQIPVAIVALVIHSYFVRSIIGVTPLDLLLVCLRSLAVTVPTVVVPLIAMSFYHAPSHPPYLILAICIAGAAVGWLAAVFLTRHPARAEVLKGLEKVRALALSTIR